MEPIDKNEAIRIATRVSAHYVAIENTKASVRDIAEATGSIIVALNHAPLVDAVEVVRCKDCRHSYKGNYFRGFACRLIDGTYTVEADDFCSRGERHDT